MYGDKAQYQPMYTGILKKMRNSGELKSIQTQIVYKNDKFKYWFDENGEHLSFEPDILSDRGEPLAVFSIGETKDGGRYIDVMTAKEVDAVKTSSKSAKSQYSPWNGAFKLEMWKKTSVRRISKKMPSSTDLDQVFASDNEDYEFEPTQKPTQDEKSPSVQNTPKSETRLDKIVKSAAKAKAEEKSPEVVEAEEENEILSEEEMPI
jgi:recombination protein RecT